MTLSSHAAAASPCESAPSLSAPLIQDARKRRVGDVGKLKVRGKLPRRLLIAQRSVGLECVDQVFRWRVERILRWCVIVEV